MKHPNHDKILSKVLEKKATKMIKQDDIYQKLKDKKVRGDFLKLI